MHACMRTSLCAKVPCARHAHVISTQCNFSQQAQCSTCKELEEKAKKLEVTVDRLRWRIDQLKREADAWRNAVSTAYSEVIAATRDQSAIKKIVNELEQKGFSVVACFSSENNLSAAAAAGQSIESGITIQRLPDGHS